MPAAPSLGILPAHSPTPSPPWPPTSLLAAAKAKQVNNIGWDIIGQTAPTPGQILCNEQPAVLESLGKMLETMHVQH